MLFGEYFLWKYEGHSLVYSMADWKWPVKLLNIQLKIQLNYSYNFAQIRVGKITIIDRANGHLGMKGTGQHRAPLGCGAFLWLKENHAGLAASHECKSFPTHEKQQPEAVLPIAGWSADERGGDAHLSTLLWCHQLDPSPAEWAISSQAHQKELELPEWPSAQPEMEQQLCRAGVFPQVAIPKHRQWNATEHWRGWRRWIQQKSFRIQGNLLLLIKHYSFPPALIQKGRFFKQPSDTREKQELQQAWRNREFYQQSRI